MSRLISIIIATYNAAETLELSFQSIFAQANSKYELLVIDGGSTDNTVEIIKKYESNISYWISEPDNGIYDAWNKGIAKASGDWIMFLGADDQLIHDALNSYLQFMNQNVKDGNFDFISSRVQMIDKNGKPIRIKGWPFEWPLFLKEMTVAHPGALHSKKLFQRYGEFDTRYKIVGDYEFLLRPGDSLKALFMDKVTVLMSEGGVSDSVNSIKEHYKAVIETGKYPKYKAFTNSIIVYAKLVIRNRARKVGLNLNLRKA